MPVTVTVRKSPCGTNEKERTGVT